MTNQEEHLIMLAEEFDTYIKNHDDNAMLDLVDLDTTPEQIDWLITRAISTGYIRTNNCFNCDNCKHFTKGGTKWEDTCEKSWDCAFYGNKQIRWELKYVQS